jgi:Ca2+/H+ antiporter, TMEM165/GDT1 family
MMCCNENRGKNFWIKRAIFIPIAIAAGIFIFGSIVMLLWNSILPAIFGIATITFWQALGILILSKILFGGFRGGHHDHFRRHADHHMRGKWMHMSQEEREKMRSEWKNRYCSEPKAE